MTSIFYTCIILFLLSSIGATVLWDYYHKNQKLVPIKDFSDFVIVNKVSVGVSNLSNFVLAYCKKLKFANNRLLYCCSMCILLFASVFFFHLNSIILIVYKENNYFIKNLKKCENTFENINDAYEMSNDILCSIYCPCNITNIEVIEFLNTTDYIKGSAKKLLNATRLKSIMNIL